MSHRTRQCGCHSPRKSHCHAVSALCHVVSCTFLRRTFENGLYLRISARILRTSQQLNRSLQHARKCPNARIQSRRTKTRASTSHAVTMTAETSTRERALQTTTQDCMHAVWQGFDISRQTIHRRLLTPCSSAGHHQERALLEFAAKGSAGSYTPKSRSIISSGIRHLSAGFIWTWRPPLSSHPQEGTQRHPTRCQMAAVSRPHHRWIQPHFRSIPKIIKFSLFHANTKQRDTRRLQAPKR